MKTAQASGERRESRPDGLNKLVRPKPPIKELGTQNLVTRSIKKAIEAAAFDCRPGGFAEYLVELSRSDVASDRATFAGCVLRLLPPVQAASGGPAVTINLGWLNGGGRQVAGSAHTVTLEQPAPSPEAEDVTP
jgi:hypothetical protein